MKNSDLTLIAQLPSTKMPGNDNPPIIASDQVQFQVDNADIMRRLRNGELQAVLVVFEKEEMYTRKRFKKW